ncbi:hypothetical protein EDB80DRAFT_740596 [Ilyonectria destructans]|nr:hypothetical protein EDB80DRAFT_740596 [Ilyonectria destructans]
MVFRGTHYILALLVAPSYWLHLRLPAGRRWLRLPGWLMVAPGSACLAGCAWLLVAPGCWLRTCVALVAPACLAPGCAAPSYWLHLTTCVATFLRLSLTPVAS